MAAELFEVKAFAWVCKECPVESQDISDDKEAIETMASFHNQLHHKEKK